MPTTRRNLYILLGLFITVAAPGAFGASSCKDIFVRNEEVDFISCPYESETFFVNWVQSRDVLYSVPPGKVPKGGFPVVFIFQGSYFPVEFARAKDVPFGGFNEVRLIKNLLDSGFAVIAPRAPGNIAWETNLQTHLGFYHLSGDYQLMGKLFAAIESGEFGPLNAQAMFATGISSGGYQSSRVAVEFPDKFKAIAIQAGSYATFMGPYTPKIEPLPENHPPTLFIHGTADKIVPIETTEPYIAALNAKKIENQMIAIPDEGHAWFTNSPVDITNWFLNHR